MILCFVCCDLRAAAERERDKLFKRRLFLAALSFVGFNLSAEQLVPRVLDAVSPYFRDMPARTRLYVPGGRPTPFQIPFETLGHSVSPRRRGCSSPPHPLHTAPIFVWVCGLRSGAAARGCHVAM